MASIVGSPRRDGTRHPARPGRLSLIALVVATVFAMTPALAAPDCSPQADEIDPRCYGALADGRHDDSAALQQAINAAVASDLPLHLVHRHFRTSQGLVIDYGQSPIHGNEGFLLRSDGATIDGTPAGTTVLELVCSGGTPDAPKGCFYFHQTGTLFVNGNTAGAVLVIGAPDFSDAQNSIRLDHVVANNSGPGAAAEVNNVLQASLDIVADSAGATGLLVRQLQFSTVTGAASATAGTGLVLADGYTISNTFASLDLEASPVCQAQLSPYQSGNVWLAIYDNCPIASRGTWAIWGRGWGAGGVLGGLVHTVMDALQ